MKKVNNIGLVNRGQKIDLTVQGRFEARVEFGEKDLLHSHMLTTGSLFSFSYCGERTLSNFGLQNRYKFFNWLYVCVYACQFITKKYNSNFIDIKFFICVNACDCYTALPYPTFTKTGRWFSISDITREAASPDPKRLRSSFARPNPISSCDKISDD